MTVANEDPRLAFTATPKPGAPVGDAQPGARTLPASVGQASLWFLRQVMPYPSPYNTAVQLRLEGELDRAALLAALREVGRRQDSFRTTFAVVDGGVVQVVHDDLPADVRAVDLTDHADPEAEARSLACAAGAEAFDLDRGPLLRARLLQLGPRTHVLVVVVDHIVADGTSLGILWREIEALYPAFRAGSPSPLLPPAKQFSTCVEEQRRFLATPAFAKQLKYWTSHLAGASSCDLPTDRPRPPARSYRGDLAVVDVPAAVVARLRAVCAAHDVSLFAALLAGLDVLLARYSGQRDVVVMVPMAGRHRYGAEAVVGYFANMVVLRTEVKDDQPFVALAQHVNKEIMAGVLRQDVPFAKVIEALRPDRSLGDDPLGRISLSFFSVPGSTLTLPDVTSTYSEIPSGGAKFDLSLIVSEHAEDLTISAELNTDVYDKETVQALLEHYGFLLASAAADPACAAADLPLVLPEEERLLARWNDTTHAFAEDRAIHEIFEAQADRTPDAIAVELDQRRLSYRELDERANQLARGLRARGVGPEVLVGVSMHRSIELVVALYGVLKAGGAYVPIDPDHPPDRLAFVLEDAKPRVILTQPALAARFADQGAEVVALDEEWSDFADTPRGRLGRDGLTLSSLAYVIYTSGSTGRPKGAMNEHRGIQNRLLWMQRAFGLGPDDRVLQKTPFSFDVSVWEFFWPLMFGARLVVARPDGHKDPRYLADLVVSAGVTTLHFVPSMLRAFVEEPRASACRSLRRVFASGEALPPPLCDRFFEVLPGVALHNLYGPTEAAVDVTHWECRPGAAVVPIGRPIDNTRVHVLDERRRPVPVGVRGELYLGGVQVGRGYLERPALTAERFVDDAFDGRPGARLYRTGDVARWLRSGEVEYLGRTDFQVKIRGYRIELGEIEATLLQHPAVREAVVVAWDAAPGDRRLVAYLSARDGAHPGVEELRAHLGARLPEYMVPAHFVTLDALPLTSSNKIDRKALPLPEATAAGERYVAPRTPAEEVLAGIWADVLGLPRVGAEDDFFALGGHSLLGMRVTARLHDAFGVDLPLRALFEARTVALLAGRIEAARASGARAPLSPIVAIPRDPPPLLSFAQQRLWFLDRLEPGDTAYNLPTAYLLAGALDAGALEQSLADLVRRHEALRTTFVEVDGEPRQIIAREAPFSLPIVDLGDLPLEGREAEVMRRASADAQRPFDLARGPLFRATLYRISERDHLLLLCAHHIVSDGWSEGVLGHELAALYRARAEGAASPLGPLAIQPADYAAWQRGWLTGKTLDDQLAYWKDKLRGAPAAIDLPADRPRPPVQKTVGTAHLFEIPRALREALEALARREGATLFMVLLAVFDALLHRYTGQDDIVVGSPIAGRSRPEIEPLLGFFVGTLVLRTELGDDPTLRALLARVRDTTLDAYAHQDTPFEKLVEALAPPRDLSRSPLFQVMLILQNAPAAPPALGEIAMRRVEVERGTAKFDLTLLFQEGGEGLSGFIEYSTALFDEDRVARMAGHLRVLLDAAVAGPARRLSELPILTAAERHQILVTWNDTARPFPEDRCLHQIVEAEADRKPEATAIVSGSDRVSYRDLDRRANRLANHLRALGVGPEVLVGLCVGRSIDMVVAILGILKAGGAYVPMDPAYPRERLAAILEDARAPVVVTEERARGALPEHRARVVLLDADRAGIEEASDARPDSGVGPRNLAYTLFTSGSTGRPKGVAVEHRSPVALLAWAWEVYGPEDTAGTLFATSMCFDLSIFELFVPLSTGGKVILAENALALPTLPAAGEVTLLNTVPSAMAELLRSGVPAGVRTVNLAGEPLTDALAQQIYAVPTIARLLNLYGPTEDTTYSTFAEGRRETGRAPPIGRPLSNGTAYVLDRHRSPVPVGVAGEVYLGGAGLARGYLHRPDLTAERFVESPFGAGRLYKTGDLARFADDGTLEYLGRIDHQVKVRGFRIELGEIEAVLRAHPAVREVVVVAREDAPGDKRVVAYVGQGDGSPSADDLRAHARTKLPEYMVPSAFVVLDALPLTPNGKVDRKALPVPGAAASPARASAGPRDDVEAKLAAIFRNVLGLREVGVHDSFFDLGGHSLLAVRLIAQIERVFGRSIALVSLFQARTVEQIAELLRRDEGLAPPGFLLVPIQPRGHKRPLFLISRPNVNSLGYIALSRHLDPERPVYSVQYDYPEEKELGRLYTQEEYATWARTYLETVRLIQPEGPYLLGGMCEGALIAFAMTRILEAAGERVAFLGMLDAWPLENTVRPLVYRINGYVEALQGLLALPAAELPRAVARKLQGRMASLRSDGPPSGPFAADRLFPGEGFVPPRVEAPITVLRVKEQPPWRISDTHLGWRSRTTGGAEVHTVAGDHFTLLREPHVATAGRVLDACLRSADPPPSPPPEAAIVR